MQKTMITIRPGDGRVVLFMLITVPWFKPGIPQIRDHAPARPTVYGTNQDSL
ncbi:hypothetical protein J2Y66_000552 [Paenarthrobacter nitroguajacolicus]|nr:hypothetical protein [Paenarthrobacter nitroguajacolicus]